MKSMFLAAGLLFFNLFLKAQSGDSITVSGTLTGLNSNKLAISFTNNLGKNQYTSVQGIKDQFSVRLPAQKLPASASLYISWPMNSSGGAQMPLPPLNFFIFDKDLQVKGNARQINLVEVQGDEENDRYSKLIQQGAKEEIRYQELLETIVNKKKLSASDSLALHREIREISMSRSNRQKKFIRSNPGAYASVFLLGRMTNQYTADNYVDAWKSLLPTYKNTPEAEGIKKTLQKLAPTMAGTPVFAFERLDKDGNPVSPELLKGKTYLLDFWGSWCGPCRASHSHLKSVYRKYKRKGFEIVAIAHERGKTLEDSKTNWLKAIQEDQINWVHILNQDGIEKQNLVSTYHITAFPTKILVGADGKIIFRISGGATDDLDKALERIYGF